MTADNEDRLYRVDGSKVWLSPTAVAYAAEYFGPGRQGVRKMAEYLRMVGADESGEGAEPAPTAVAREDFLPGVTPSENVEDRRDEHFVPDKTMQQIWGPVANIPLEARTFGPNPLANALGFGDVGKRAAPAPRVMGPFQPQMPAAFGNYRPPPPGFALGGAARLIPGTRAYDPNSPISEQEFLGGG
jgi:hypothetical protein